MAKVKARKTRGPYVMAAMFCENVLEEKDNVTSVIRIVDVLKIQRIEVSIPANLPTNLRVSPPAPPPMNLLPGPTLMLVIAFKSGDVKGERRLQLIGTSPSGKKLVHPETPVMFLGGETGVNVRGRITLNAEEQGLYWYDVMLDGKVMTRMPLRIEYDTSGQTSSSEQASEQRST